MKVLWVFSYICNRQGGAKKSENVSCIICHQDLQKMFKIDEKLSVGPVEA